MLGASSGAVRQQGRCGALRGDPGTPCDSEVRKGYPSQWVRCAGTVTVGARRYCGCGVAPPSGESTSMCSVLSNNTLNGRVPSSLSALTNLEFLCVPPFCQRRLGAAEEGRIGRLCSEYAARRGMHVGGIERGGAAAGLSRYSQRGTLARDVLRSTQGVPLPMGTVRGYCRGTSLLWVRRSTAQAAESASGVQ
jgi:hypothetical protein